MRHFALRLQRPPGGSLRDIRENAEYFLPLRLYHYAIVVLRAVLISHPSRAESFSPLQNLSPVTMTSARFSRADIQEILNNTTISDILPCGYNDLRAVRSRDIRENAECVLPLQLYPYAIAVLRAVLVSHPSRAEYLVEVFQEPSLAETAGEREGSDVSEHVAPGYW